MKYDTVETLLKESDDSNTKEEHTQHNESSTATKISKTQTKQEDPLSEENLDFQMRYPLLTQMNQDLDKTFEELQSENALEVVSNFQDMFN